MTKPFEDGQDYDEEKHRGPKLKRQHQDGYCLACNSPIEFGSFCDDWCKEDHEFEQEMRKIIGKPKR